MYVRGIQKNCTDEPSSRAKIKTQTGRMDVWTQAGNWTVGLIGKLGLQ